MEKLIRDRIPEIIKNSGRAANIRTADENEMWGLLKQKLVEEANELLASDNIKSDCEEFADVLEVIEAMMDRLSPSKIRQLQLKKAEDRGMFDKRYVIKLDDFKLSAASHE